MRVFLSAVRYLAGKVLTILLTIFVAIFITLLIVNYPAGPTLVSSPFEQNLEAQIYYAVSEANLQGVFSLDAMGNPVQSEVDQFVAVLRAEAGLDLPFVPRYLLWTAKAFTFDWGRVESQYFAQIGMSQGLSTAPTAQVILEYFPNTLLIVGTAYLLTFLIGLPLALYLARHYGSRLDRIFSMLSPISSVPSWVFAVLLITIFAVQLRWLPVGGTYEFFRPKEPIPYMLQLLRHMVLPVSALLLSLLFQLVYSWRTFFILYSQEDYVDLARAKGLETRVLEKQYILRPALPYIITSFATSLIGFWQLTVALEKIFDWPGIGVLYIESLPNYWGERVSYGDLMIVVQLVVTFSYLLGLLALILDLVYVIVDPRIHLIPSSNRAQTSARVKNEAGWSGRLMAWMKAKASGLAKPIPGPVVKRTFSTENMVRNVKESWREARQRGKLFAEQLLRYPSAMFGLTVITLLIAGSIYAFAFLPYEEIGMDFDQNRMTGRNLRPRVAAPAWMNVFTAKPLLSTLIMEDDSEQTKVVYEQLENGWVQKTTTFQFDYSYREIPSDVFIYLDPSYEEKIPFVSMQWTTPDGRTIDLKSKAIAGDVNYDLKEGLNVSRLLSEHPDWRNWFETEGQYPTPAYSLLFAKPGSTTATPQNGTYLLAITTLLFEDGSDLKPQLVLLGQVYGTAGTDLWRRDLTVPLFWGMPITLLVGFFGTFITTLIAMLLPAVGVWFGGGLDNFIQRLTEINMVLPGLAIAVLLNAVFGIHIWIILGVVVVLNALGAPIKSFRSAFLQAKEAPYIEMARSYGASNFRIITRYLIPRILPVLIPTLVAQIPSFIFLEATLGFFNIRSTYPSWGRIIYEGLSRGALYGSPYWVLQPIFLLLLTGLAFAMLGSALERILNPRVIDEGPTPGAATAPSGERRRFTGFVNRRTAVGLAGLLLLFLAVISFGRARIFANSIVEKMSPSFAGASSKPTSDPELVKDTNTATKAPLSTDVPVTVTVALATATPSLSAPSEPPTVTSAPVIEPTALATDTPPVPTTYTLKKGEYPYCIARRFDIDPGELLRLNEMADDQRFYTGMELRIPETAGNFPGNRQLLPHPTTYIVSSPNESLYTVACKYGDMDPQAIAQANQIQVDSSLLVGQQLTIP